MSTQLYLRLNHDCLALVFSFLDKRSLLALAHTSRAACETIRPLLVQDVYLWRSAQFIRFSVFVNAHNLAPYIRSYKHNMILDSDVHYLSLADMLKKAVNMVTFSVTWLGMPSLQASPAIVDALASHPSLQKLEIACSRNTSWIPKVISMARGLSELDITLVSEPLKEDHSVAADVSEILCSSKQSLRTLKVTGSPSYFLAPITPPSGHT